MKKTFFIGIDISKNTVDACLMCGTKPLRQTQMANDRRAIEAGFEEFKKDFGFGNEDFLVCAEHTGKYGFQLKLACIAKGYDLCMEDPTQIKRSSGVTRGKSDKADARRIAEYASRFQDRLRVNEYRSEELDELKELESQRRLLSIQKSTLERQIRDDKGHMADRVYRDKERMYGPVIASLRETIERIERRMDDIIRDTDELSRMDGLLQTVDGVGPVLSRNMIIVTLAFVRFKDPRKFCCYGGMAPFRYTSGTSVNSRNKVSGRANKHIKSLLHMAALVAATRCRGGDLREYYERKVAEGKNPMSVLNAVRAKIVARMFAVIRDGRPYQRTLPSSTERVAATA